MTKIEIAARIAAHYAVTLSAVDAGYASVVASAPRTFAGFAHAAQVLSAREYARVGEYRGAVWAAVNALHGLRGSSKAQLIEAAAVHSIAL